MSSHFMVRPAVFAFAAALAPFAAPAAAAPPAWPTSKIQGERLAQPVACWWHNGVRRCNNGYTARRYGQRYYGYGPSYGYRYGAPRPEQLPFGSTEWWRAMDREGRGGYRR